MKRSKKFARRLLSFLMAGCLMAMLCIPVYAYWFAFNFMPPFNGSLRYTTSELSTGAPYVKHDLNTQETNYALQVRAGGSVSSDPLVSNTIYNYANTVKRSFTYKTGYGGAGQKYYMIGYPSNVNFNQYTTGKDWSP